MTRKRLFISLILFTAAAILFLTSCSQARYPYKNQKRKKKCDCPRWSYQINPKTFYLYSNDQGPERSAA